MNKICVLVLAGGDSTRVWPIYDKLMLKFNGYPLIYYTLLRLKKFGFRDIVIVTNKNSYGSYEKLITNLDLNASLVIQKDFRGMAGAILSAKKEIINKKLLIVSPADICEDLIYYNFQKFLLNNNSDIILTGQKVSSYFPGGYLTLDEHGFVTGIMEKPDPKSVSHGFVTLVFDYFQNSSFMLKSLENESGDGDDLFERALAKLIKSGVKASCINYDGYWGFIKYPWHVLNVNAYFLSKIQKPKTHNCFISNSAVISGNVYLEEGVKVLENAKIIGPCFIGGGTIIGNNSLVRESTIGSNCVIGFSTEVARSHIGDNCWFHNNYIGDSVLGDNIGIGSGSVLANFRLDEGNINSKISGKFLDTGKTKLGSIIGSDSRIGVNASIMPGVKIGKASFLAAGTVLSVDLPDGSYCYMDFKACKIKKNLKSISGSNRESILNNLKLK